MNRIGKRILLMAVLLCVLTAVCGCHSNPSQEQLYAKMFAHFENRGFQCALLPVNDESTVPIYKPSAWKRLMLDEEELLVYFDDSNRADYLSTFVDEETFGPAWCFGLRFVLVYNGTDQRVLDALNQIDHL